MKEILSLNKYFLRYRWRILAGVLFVILANALNTYTPVITKNAVNLITYNLHKLEVDSPDKELAKSELATGVLKLFFTYLIVALMAGGFTFLMRQTIIVVSRMIEYDMKNEIYAHYQSADLAFLRRNNTGDLMNRITEDVSRVRMYVGPAIMYSVNLFFTIVFAVATMFSIHPKLTMLVLIPLPVLSFIIYYVNKKVDKYSSLIQAKLSDLTTDAQETYSGIRVVQAYNREAEMKKHFELESEAYKTMQLRLARIDSVYFPVMSLLVGVSIIITIYAGGKLVGNQSITTGDIVAFLMYTNMLMWPVSSLGWVASMIQRAIASQRRINEFLNEEPEIANNNGITKNIHGDIVFDSVNFVYPDTKIHALKDVSFHIKPGERWAVIGKTGSGKTTLAELILRMYDSTSGKVMIDGIDVQQYKLQHYRKQVGYVPQDVFLFSTTISENIAFGAENADTNTIHQFAKYAAIHNEILSLKDGYETMVGERGVTLSGGQKQRISIARALVKQPNLLILDDCLSAVDTHTEKLIQQNFDTILRGKTCIVITHRIFALMTFDNIIVMDDGKIVEQGTHKQLMEANGVYASIYERQLLEQNEQTNVNVE